MNWYPLPRTTVASWLVLSLGCSAALGCSASQGSDPIADDHAVGQTTASMSTLNPCDPKWQLPTSAMGDPVDDAIFRAFENELAAGGALWIGSFDLPDPYRAIVRVDQYASINKKLVDSHLWFLAAIPIDSTDALAAVDVYARMPPVNAKAIGHCLNDRTFVSLGETIPVNRKVVSEITEYDPRCVCIVADGLLRVVE